MPGVSLFGMCFIAVATLVPTSLNAPAAALKPSLLVIDARATIQPNCQNPKPALIATINLRNIGASLAAGRGTLYVSEDGNSPHRLISSGVDLPAFATGDTKSITIPVIALSPYAKLAGNHQLTVQLLPIVAEGDYAFAKPNADYRFTVFFPMNFCQLARKTPAPPSRKQTSSK